MSQLRTLIREIITDELSKQHQAQPQITEESVSIKDNAELSLFVHRIIEMAQDERLKADIASGRYIFKLTTEAPPFQAHQPMTGHPGLATAFFESGLITEKDVAGLPADMTYLEIGKTTHFTPLARDELRRKGIKIERRLS